MLASRILITSCRNPFLNLAKELDLLYSPRSAGKILYLWQNSPTVVIGKHQNPYKECNLSFMSQHNVSLARRQTGGGAVYQDLGNACWTFVSDKPTPDVDTGLLVDSLGQLGISAYATGRNDIEVKGKKVSGAAFRRIPSGSLHHGTLLMNTDVQMMEKCLKVDATKLEAKGVASVRSRVTNLCEIVPSINFSQFCEVIAKSFQKEYGKCEIEELTEQSVRSESSVNRRYLELSSKEWIYGQGSEAAVTTSNLFDFGLFDVTLKLDAGKVTRVIVHSDCLETEVVELFEKALNGPYRRNGFDQGLVKSLKGTESQEMLQELFDWITPEIQKWSI
jgi:lipoate-protein ligase A